MLKTVTLTLAGALFALAAGSAHADEVVINAVHFTPTQNSYAQSFLKFVAEVNKAGKGVVQIKVRGGPEVVPPNQQGSAQKSGLVDMIDCPAGLYLEMVPEGEVFSASSKTPQEVRENGGWALMNQIYGKKGNAHLLAHVDAGAGFHVFTVNPPKKTANGGIEWSSLKIRSAPLYRQFFESLGATVIVESPGEIYTSLERGVVNANAYTIFGYHSFGWDKFTKYRIDPSFFQTDVLISMNKDKWDGLSAAAKKILNDTAVAFEKESAAANATATKEEGEAMIAAGQKVVALEGAGRADYLAKASKASWDRMTKRDPTYVPELRKHFE
jgi:TRAP-type C4-dicarboxylate transport system substrate-binding protein